MVTLEGFLNAVIPISIFVFLAAAMYWKLQQPLNALFIWIGSLFGWTKDKLSESPGEYYEEIVYR